MIVILHEDNHVEGASGPLLAFLSSHFPYRGASVSVEDVQERIDSGIKLDAYKYEIVDGVVVAKDGSPVFTPDPEWVSPQFSDSGYTIRWSGQTITPDTELSDFPEGIAAFCNAIYSYNNGEYRAKWEAKQLEVEVSPEPTPEELKALERAKIEQAYNSRIDVLVAGYPEKVRETWPSQESEARAWLLDNTAPTPTLDGIVERSGRDKAALVNSIITKADYFKRESGRALGDMQAALAAIDRG